MLTFIESEAVASPRTVAVANVGNNDGSVFGKILSGSLDKVQKLSAPVLGPQPAIARRYRDKSRNLFKALFRKSNDQNSSPVPTTRPVQLISKNEGVIPIFRKCVCRRGRSRKKSTKRSKNRSMRRSKNRSMRRSSKRSRSHFSNSQKDFKRNPHGIYEKYPKKPRRHSRNTYLLLHSDESGQMFARKYAIMATFILGEHRGKPGGYKTTTIYSNTAPTNESTVASRSTTVSTGGGTTAAPPGITVATTTLIATTPVNSTLATTTPAATTVGTTTLVATTQTETTLVGTTEPASSTVPTTTFDCCHSCGDNGPCTNLPRCAGAQC